MAIGMGMMGAAIGLYLMTQIWNPLLFWIGVIITIISFFFGGSDCPPVEVTFECKPWKPPIGGEDCEKCNDDPLKPCSEYRCHSLGAACELINKGSEQEMCHSSSDDGRPPILNPQIDVISETEKYGDITSDGFSITNLNGGCVDAYTPLLFGIVTDELAYCRFDIELKEFSEMDYDLGGNAYIKNHTTVFTLPDPSHGQSQGADWTGDLNLYIKCEDAFGHITPNFYIVDICVKEGPDSMGPRIRATNPLNDAIVGFDEASKNVSVVTDELATCRWDVVDVDYSLMLLWRMKWIVLMLMGVHPTFRVIYVMMSYRRRIRRILDQPWLDELNRSNERNANVESAQYLLRKPEKKIEIDWIEPSQDFEVNTEMTSIELQVQTSGGGEFHWCSYSFLGYENMIKMFETGNDRVHVQPLNRPAGTDKIYVQCEDETGDSAQGSTEFRIIYDTSTPQVARVWQIGNTLHVVTTEPAECVYSTDHCNFNWDDGTSMSGTEEFTIGVIAGEYI